MTVKEYLGKVRRNRQKCRVLRERIEELEHEMSGLKGIRYDKDKVQASPDGKMEKIFDQLEVIRARYATAVLRYHLQEEKIRKQIMDMPNEMHREVLILRYIEEAPDGRQLTFDQISERMHKSIEWTWHLHGYALQEFARLYKKSTGKNRQVT